MDLVKRCMHLSKDNFMGVPNAMPCNLVVNETNEFPWPSQITTLPPIFLLL